MSSGAIGGPWPGILRSMDFEHGAPLSSCMVGARRRRAYFRQDMNRRRDIEDMAPDLAGRAAGLSWPAAAGAVFDAILTPNRSLPRRGFIAVMAAVAGCSAAVSAGFFIAGAWPVIGFCGLDVLLVWAAFKLSYRQGRLKERVRLTRDHLLVSRILPSGHETRWRLDPRSTRVAIDRPVGHESQVRVLSKGRTLILGSFLSPEERGDFADALRAALGGLRVA